MTAPAAPRARPVGYVRPGAGEGPPSPRLRHRPDPEVAWLWSLPGSPPGRPPESLNALLRLRGYLPPVKYSPFVTEPPEKAWQRWLEGCGRGKAWWSRPDALHVPRRWPGLLDGSLPDHLTPLAWVRELVPKDRSATRGMKQWAPPGTGELAAAAVGFPLTEGELRKARGAVEDLMGNLHFLIWVYDLDLDGLPLPMDLDVGLAEKLRARAAMQERAITHGARTARMALPASVLEEPWRLLVHCRRRSNEVSRTTKRCWKTVFSPKNLTRLEERGLTPPLEGV